jgi:hypothetical protein
MVAPWRAPSLDNRHRAEFPPSMSIADAAPTSILHFGLQIRRPKPPPLSLAAWRRSPEPPTPRSSPRHDRHRSLLRAARPPRPKLLYPKSGYQIGTLSFFRNQSFAKANGAFPKGRFWKSCSSPKQGHICWWHDVQKESGIAGRAEYYTLRLGKSVARKSCLSHKHAFPNDTLYRTE